ncbi:hypothetical protein J3T99_01925 [Acetobacteraceae bacterium B3987]|nr:hypothetical protein [Acetobacteraceae bacterium B3987]
MSDGDKGNPVGKFFSTLLDDLTGKSDHGSSGGPFEDTRTTLDSVSHSLGTSNFRKAIMDAVEEKKDTE